MSHANGIISAPVSLTSDVVAILGGDSRVSAVCTSNNINPYSKYKPVSKAQITKMSDEDFRSVNWGYICPSINESSYNNFGNVNASELFSARDIVAMIFNKLNLTMPNTSFKEPTGSDYVAMRNFWYYKKPSSYFRLGDFDRYNHNTVNSMMDWELYSSTINLKESFSEDAVIDIGVYSQNSNSQVLPDEMCDAIKGFYLGIIACKSDVNTPSWYVNSATVAKSGNRFTMKKSDFIQLFAYGEGTYKVLPVLSFSTNSSLGQLEHGSFDTIQQFIPLPCSYTNVNVISKDESDIPPSWAGKINFFATNKSVSRNGIRSVRYSFVLNAKASETTHLQTSNTRIKIVAYQGTASYEIEDKSADAYDIDRILLEEGKTVSLKTISGSFITTIQNTGLQLDKAFWFTVSVYNHQGGILTEDFEVGSALIE